ncbi:LPD38 domain-containing protein [Pseudomonas sp. NPDC077649]|uniref:LPD38 domain-containing protein n=1 Tax=Pseudomonas sp. NPDC077649 TaxID=3364423 RepID=UPI0037CB2620
MANFFDQFDAAGDGGEAGNFFDRFDESPPSKQPAKQNTSLLGDLGTDLKRGVQQLPGVVTGLADVGVAGLTGRRFVDEAADKVGEATGFQPSQWQEEAREEYSPARQAGTAEIDQAWEEGDALDVAGAYARNPGNVAGLVAESIPQMLAGGAIGRGALVGGRAAGLIAAPATAGQAARQAIAAGAGGEGAVIAGGTMDQIDREVDPQRAAAAAAGAGVIGAALSGFGARLAQRAGLIDVDSVLAGGVGQAAGQAPGLARRVAGGAFTEGVLEELPQSIQEQMLQNWAERKPLMEGVPRAAVEGTLAGSAIGGAVNVARRPSEQMGIDPAAGPLSSAAATAVDGAATPVRDATRAGLLSGAPEPQPGGGYQPIDQQLAIAQELFPTDLDAEGNLHFYRYDRDLQVMVEVPEAEALAAARAQLAQAEQEGFDPQDTRGLDELVPQVEELPEQPPLPTVEVDSGPQAVERVEQPLPLATVDSDTGPMVVEEVQATPVAGDPNFEIRVQKNGRPFRGERDVRLLKLFNDLQQAGERPVVVPHEGGWAVAVPREPVAPPAPLGLPAPSTMVVDSQGNAERGATAPFVEPRAQVRPIGGPGMERQAPASRVDQQAQEAATSLSNDLPEPSQAQIEAGNYRKGHVRVAGLDISIENPRGSVRRGRRPDGSEWSHEMSDHYGYIRRTEGADGEQVDVYVGPQEDSQRVFIVDQVNQQDGNFDEHKVMLGYPDMEAAIAAYRSNFDAGWKVGPVTELSRDRFRDWLRDGDLTSPLQEVQDADSRAGSADDGAAGNPPAAADAADNVAREPVVAERPAAARGTAKPGRPSVPAATQGADGQRALSEPPADQEQDQAALPEILAMPRKRYIDRQAKAAGIKKGSPGYDQAIQRLQDQYEADVDRASAGITFEQYNELNSDSPEGVNRQAWQALRQEYGVDQSDATQPAAEQATQEGERSKEKIDDFGERLEGARKFMSYTQRLEEASQLDVAAVPLSKSWPEPDYQAMLDEGADPWGVAFMRAAREEILTKPSKSYKLSRWSEQVKALRDMAQQVAGDPDYAKRVKARAGEFSTLDRGFLGRVELYERFGHAVPLKGITFRSNWYSLYHGEKNVEKWVVAGKPAKSMLSNWPREIAVGNTRDEALAGFSRWHAAQAAKPEADSAGPAVRFDLFTDRYTREVFIGKKNGKRVVKMKTFPSLREASDYRRDHQADLEAQYQRMKEAPPTRAEDNAPRLGVDHRNGQDVTPELFAETFGFRGVQFGNWVEDKRRQQDLNDAFDGLMDLAGILNIPARSLSLNGELGLAFGARGRGGIDAGAAHYEPDTVVINLTKARGAGSLAHEWWHSLDNYLSRARNQDGYLTETPYERGPGVRAELVAAFKELMRAIGTTGIKARSEERDKMRTSDYWSTGREMTARAFESYVIAKLDDHGLRNDYLANVISGEAVEREASYPYPTAAEIPAVRAAYDGIFSVIESREDSDGNVALYSRQSYRIGQPGGGSRAAQIRLQLARLTGGWQNAPEVKVVQSVKDLPDRQRRTVERDGAFDIEGILSDGTVYLVADNLRDVKHAAFVLQHEVLGHAGLQGAYGARLKPLLMSIYNGNPDLKAQADQLVRRHGYEPAVAMEEVLADMAADGSIQQQGFWSRLVAAMRAALRSIGMNLQWSEGDIQLLLGNARRYIQSGRRSGSGRTVYSRNGDSGRLVELLDDKGRLLAPNGKPSNLNQKQWHQVRSDNFKRWFGDWQAVDAQKRLDAKAPLKLRMLASWKELSERERLAKVEESLKGMARLSEALPHDELGDVTMAMSGAKKAASTAADPAKQAVLSKLQQSFENSIYASSTLSTQSGQTAAYHKLLAPIDIDGVPLVAVFTVREDVNGRMFYNTVTVNRKEDALAVSPGDVSKAQGSLPANTKALDTFVRRPLDRVNPEDVSAVTDGNGEPMVLHHGTAEQFNVFDQGRAGVSTGHTTAPLGIFLTSDPELAQAYAEKATDGMPGLANVMPLFASIKNPYRMSIAESQALDTTDKAIAFRQKLEREGYDGIQLQGSPTWVAFYNSQVKSATNNTGAFDDIDPDIRYSRASQREIEAMRKLGLAGSEAQNLLDQVRNLTLGGLQAKLKEWSVRSEEGIFDGLAGIRRAEEAVGVTDVNQQGYVSARMASGIADVMHGVLHYAAPEWRDGVVSGKAGTRGVLEILGDLGQDNLTPWLAWLGGKRGQLLKAQGRENNLSDTDIAELLAMGNGKEDLFERVYREYAQTNEAVLDLAQEAGLIDQDARAKWLTDYYVPFYRQDEAEGIFTAPRSKRGLSHQTAAIKALKGGGVPTNDLLANMLAGWTKRIDAAMKNKALLEVVDNLQGSDFLTDESPRWQQVLISRDQIAQQIRKDRKALVLAADLLDLPAGSNAIKVVNQLMKPENEGFEKLWTRVAPTDPDIIRVQRGGKSEYYRVNDESLLRGLKFIEGSVFNDPITKIGRAFKRLLTTGVTASPDFILRNFIRDAAHAWLINKDGFTLGKDSIKGMRDALREDQDYRDLMFAGGSFQGGYVHGTDPEASAQIIRRALEKKGFTRTQQDAYLGSLVNTPAKAAAMLGMGWQKYRALGDKVENANRLSTYKAALEAGKGRRQAAYEAKDLMDYSLRGNFAAAQWFTDVVPFLNARLQGLYKLGRAAKGDKTLLAKEVAMKGGYIALFSLLLAGLNDDDERYQALMDWDKDMHWHIFLGDQHFRIPKPFELGLIFGTVPERILHAMTGSQDGGDLASAVSRGVFQTLAFNPVPQFYQPIRELQANRNFFRDAPIEDMSDEGKLPEARYDERTSGIGRLLGQVTGPIAGLSPKQIDHLVAGYTGTIGQYVLDMSSLLVSAFDDADRPASRAGDVPILKVLYQGDAPRSTKYQSEFYDMMREADQLNRTIKAYREEGRVEAADQLLAKNREKLRHRPALGLARKQLGNIRNQMDAVYRDTRMTPEAKRQRLDALQLQANQVAQRIVNLAEGDF